MSTDEGDWGHDKQLEELASYLTFTMKPGDKWNHSKGLVLKDGHTYFSFIDRKTRISKHNLLATDVAAMLKK